MAQAPFLALITPIGETVTPQPPGIWGPTDPRPSNPIAGMGPGGNFPGQPPLGIWGPTDPRPGTGLPGPQPMPTPPIYFPPEGNPPPLGIWGPTDPRPGWGLPGEQPKPSHPIVLPPDLPDTIPPEGELPETPIDWRVGWTATTGWIVVGIPQGPHPTPSRR